MKRLLFVLLAGLPLGLGFSSRPAPAMLPPRHGADLVVHAEGEVRSLDPVQARTPAERDIVVALFEGLVRRENDRHVPVAALDWSTSPDGRTWTFRLRPGTTFTDGTPVDADAFVRSWSRRDPASRRHPLDGVTAVAADPLTLRLQMAQPVAGFLDSLALPEAVVVRLNGSGGLVGSGPFRFAGTKDGAFTLAPRLDHHAGRPFPARIVVHTGVPAAGRSFDLVHAVGPVPAGAASLPGGAGYRSPRLAGVVFDPLAGTVRLETAWLKPGEKS